MKKLKIVYAIFAEGVQVRREPLNWIDTINHHKFIEMYLDDIGMLWIHDMEAKTWFGTSSANLRMIRSIENPFNEVVNETQPRSTTQRAGKEGRARG